MEDELSAILGRKLDLVSRRAIERSANWTRRKLPLLRPAHVHKPLRIADEGFRPHLQAVDLPWRRSLRRHDPEAATAVC